MTTFAALPDSQRRRAELDARTHAAWMAYRDELRDLHRDAYADAEPGAWERLQSELGELATLRAELPEAR